MKRIRVLRLFHAAVVKEYRERERWLREKHGYDVHVVCPPAWHEGAGLVEAEPDADVPLHVVPVHGRQHAILFWYSSRHLRRLLRELRPHVLDIHEEPYSLAARAAVRAAEREGISAPICIYTAQNIYKRYPPPFGRSQQRVLERTSAAYPCSSGAAAVLRRKGYRGWLDVIPLGVPLEATPPRRPVSSRLRVGFVGRLVPEKGADLALAAFARAARGLDASLEIVGDGPAESALRDDARRLGLNGEVAFVGAVSQREALDRIASFDVLVVPSRTTARWKEQFGRVAAEALVAGTPVLASTCGSLPELLEGCGESFEEGSTDDFAEKLGRLLRDARRRHDLSRAGLRRAQASFSWEAVADRVDRMYRTVLGHA